MATKEEINSLIAESMSEMNETRSEKIPLGKLGSVVLYGEWGVFDSLQLVNFLMNLEEKISDKLDLSLSLTSDRAVSRKVSPFRSPEHLADFILEEIAQPVAG